LANDRTILVIDDEVIMQETLSDFLQEEGFVVEVASSGEEGLELARVNPYDCAIVDLMMPGMDGIQTTQALKEHDATLPVIMITAYASVESAVEAMKHGAHEYITKPFKIDEVLLVIENAIRQRALELEVRSLRLALRDKYRFENIVGKNRKMQEVFALVSQAAPSRSTILVQGESGTGKELVAKAIHANSTRADKPFVTVNSGAMPSELLESNLFGHEKGSFTGAISTKKGLFEVADGGTIFLDEIANIAPDVQAKLLRVIQEREFMRVGGVETIKTDVRIISATNADLRQLVAAGEFREDLYYRLNVISIMLPSLNERADDIPLLAQHFLDKYAEENGREGLVIGEDALDVLRSYHWPGNVRELENAIERAVVLAPPDGHIGARLVREYIDPEPLESASLPRPMLGAAPLRGMVEEFEKRLILRALEQTDWVQKEAAALLDVKPTTLNEKIKRYGIRDAVKEHA
jgi:DNA-binding NtrC family response regulator